MSKDFDIAWLAGLLEGEGCFFLSGRAAPRVSLLMKDEDIVLRAAKVMNASTSVREKIDNRSPNYSNTFQLSISGLEAFTVMKLIRPYMGERRGAKIDMIMNTVMKYRPNIECGRLYCSKMHSIKNENEYFIDINGTKRCKRCYRMKIRLLKDKFDPKIKVTNPFLKRDAI